jgi:hypothetical protein
MGFITLLVNYNSDNWFFSCFIASLPNMNMKVIFQKSEAAKYTYMH